MELFMLVVGSVAGYAAAVHTWPALRQYLLGAEEELTRLRRRARDLERRLRG